jgi:hypothetical protein
VFIYFIFLCFKVNLSIFREVKDIVQEFYKLELIVLNDKDLDDSSTLTRSKSNLPTRYNLIVLANAAAIDLYFLCVEDEQGIY